MVRKGYIDVNVVSYVLKEEGGLGCRSLAKFNLALLA